MIKFFLLGLLSMQLGIAFAHAGEAEKYRPNIVIIIADDLGWNDVGYNGSEIATPNLDKLANEGVILNRFYAQPTCTPTRAALMTGKSPLRLGVTYAIGHANKKGLPLEERTLAQFFQEAGYQTALFGKWHLGHASRDYWPTSRGFDYFYGNLLGGIGYYTHVHSHRVDWQRNGETVREEGYTEHLLTDDLTRAIEERDPKKPMFLIASYNVPHLPNEAPEKSIKRYRKIDDPHRRVHAAMTHELDIAIGKVVKTLEKENMLENTLIWFMSDNGGLNPGSFPKPQIGMFLQLQDWYGAPLPLDGLEFFRSNILDGGSDNTPLRSGKGSVYDGGARVPALVYWKGSLEPNESNQMITAQDVLPTLLAAANIEVSDPAFDGLQQWSALSENAETPIADYFMQTGSGEAAYRYPWKLIAFSDGRRELYNVEDDPSETNDVSGAQPEMVANLIEALSEIPRGESVSILPTDQEFMRSFMQDPDIFGGEETLPSYTEIAH
ncbi:MAG: arylsulfatase [Pseudomonadota bacterium]